MNIFDEIKTRLEVETAANFYGIQVTRGKADCSFHHSDKHPSMSFKGPYYRCWSCGIGDVIDFVSWMFGLSVIGAAKKLNAYFSLGFELSKPIPAQRIREIKNDNRLYKAFDEWEKSAFETLANRIHQLKSYKRTFGENKKAKKIAIS